MPIAHQIFIALKDIIPAIEEADGEGQQDGRTTTLDNRDATVRESTIVSMKKQKPVCFICGQVFEYPSYLKKHRDQTQFKCKPVVHLRDNDGKFRC